MISSPGPGAGISTMPTGISSQPSASVPKRPIHLLSPATTCMGPMMPVGSRGRDTLGVQDTSARRTMGE